MTQTQRSRLKKQCDSSWSKFIRERDKKCQRCGRREPLDAAHIISRTYMATRYDFDNGMALCKGCHLWWHAEPILATRWLESRWPGRFDRLDFKRRSITKVDLQMVTLMLQHDLKWIRRVDLEEARGESHKPPSNKIKPGNTQAEGGDNKQDNRDNAENKL